MGPPKNDVVIVSSTDLGGSFCLYCFFQFLSLSSIALSIAEIAKNQNSSKKKTVNKANGPISEEEKKRDETLGHLPPRCFFHFSPLPRKEKEPSKKIRNYQQR